MTRRAAQLNIRSDKARQRVNDLVYETGKTATQLVEEAVLAYHPTPVVTPPMAPPPHEVPEGLEWNGRYLVIKSLGGPKITLEETNNIIEEGRNRPLFDE